MVSKKPTLTEIIEGTKKIIEQVKEYLNDNSKEPESIESQTIDEDTKE